MSKDHNEEAHSKGEHIDLFSIVSVVILLVVTLASESLDGIFNFRCFVAFGSNIFCQHRHFMSVVLVFGRDRSKAEVSDFDIELLVYEQILQLQVPMRNALSVAIVDAFEDLAEGESRHLLIEWTGFRDQIEEISMLSKFECNIAYFS
jgi:hypothetical protein